MNHAARGGGGGEEGGMYACIPDSKLSVDISIPEAVVRKLPTTINTNSVVCLFRSSWWAYQN